jgi:hypothetical protein
MRLHYRLAALAAAASLLAMAPASAWAEHQHGTPAKHPNPTGTCNVNINAAPGVLEAGETVSVFGRLNCVRRAAAANRTVTLLQRTATAPGFKVLATTTTDRHGFYLLTTPAVSQNSVFKVRANGAASGQRGVKVFARVTFAGPAEGTQLFTGVANKVTFTGTVSPADAGAVVVLQRQNAVSGNEWHRIQRGIVGPTGSYSITHTFVVPGDANIRVLVRSHGLNIPSPSDLLTYEISQAQNPQLTITATPDPISYGQSVAISGTLAGASAGTPVTLFAHTARQDGFAAVAEVKTVSGGGYAFPAQAPVESTFYQVRGGGQSSAVLYEGVKDVLTVTVSGNSIPAGQPLTFKGAVSPDHTGHVIYLQQQNHADGGFHTVEVATVGSGSEYSIVHAVYEPGTQVFRVKIPGGPDDEGAASPPITVVVTVVPAASLTPERSGNTGLPPQGEV